MDKLQQVKNTLSMPEAELILHIRETKVEFGKMILIVNYEHWKPRQAQAAHGNVVENWLLTGRI